jgi:DNA-binding transcriptional LysR family regulator
VNLQEIEAFVAIAETGSVNRAALRLHITQPAASRRLQNFEASLGGAALLDRSAKPPVLTPAGRQVLERCRRILKAVSELEESVSTSGRPSGPLRIGVAHGLGEVVLGTPLEAMRSGLPDVRLQISSNWTRLLIEEIRSGALDCAIGLITREHLLPSGVQVLAIGPEKVVIVAAKGARPRKAKDRLRLRDLADKGWILNPAGCGCRSALQRAFDGENAPMRVMAEVFGEDLQLSMIARSAGFGLVPRRQFEQSPYRSLLRIVDVQDFSLQATVAVLHGSALGSLSAPVQQLHRHIAANLRGYKYAA